MACYADTHVRVLKRAGGDGRMTTAFERLSSTQQRVAEVADMLGGCCIGAGARGLGAALGGSLVWLRDSRWSVPVC